MTFTFRVGGGTDPSEDYPWIAKLFCKQNTLDIFQLKLIFIIGFDRFICTASIISERFVITAANCLKKTEGEIETCNIGAGTNWVS